MVTYASKGYAFINLTTPDAAAALVAAWSGRCLVDMGDEACSSECNRKCVGGEVKYVLCLSSCVDKGRRGHVSVYDDILGG
eukprot:5929093-Amphidinium_carterae.1